MATVKSQNTTNMVGTESGPGVEEGVQPGMFSQIPPTPKGVDADEAEAVPAWLKE